MEGLSKALEQPEYVHVLLNHLPLTGLVVALMGLLAGLAINRRGILLVALALVAVTSFSAWPVARFGEDGFDRVFSMTDDAGGQYLEHHKALADRWIFLFYLTAASATAALVAGWKKPGLLRWAGVAAAVLALASLAAGAAIADSGGKVRHREFRFGPPPAHAPDASLSRE